MNETLRLHVTGMTCGGCENAVTRTLMKLNGVEAAAASRIDETVTVDYRPEAVGVPAIREAIVSLGYEVPETET